MASKVSAEFHRIVIEQRNNNREEFRVKFIMFIFPHTSLTRTSLLKLLVKCYLIKKILKKVSSDTQKTATHGYSPLKPMCLYQNLPFWMFAEASGTVSIAAGDE